MLFEGYMFFKIDNNEVLIKHEKQQTKTQYYTPKIICLSSNTLVHFYWSRKALSSHSVCFPLLFFSSGGGLGGSPWPGQGTCLQGSRSSGLKKRVQKSIFLQKQCFQKKCIKNTFFQMCAQSPLDHFGHGKTKTKKILKVN